MSQTLTGQTAVWASALCEGDDLVAKADGEPSPSFRRGVDSDLGTYSNLGRRVTLQSRDRIECSRCPQKKRVMLYALSRSKG